MSRQVQLRPLSSEEQKQLERLSRSRTEPARTVERARILLLKAEGRTSREVAQLVGRGQEAVVRGVMRFNATGLAGLADETRSGRPRQ